VATRVPDARRNAMVDTVVDALDAGAAAGKVEIRSGSQPADADDAASGTLLATITLSDPAFGAASAGTATANAIAAVAATTTGTAGWFRALDSDNNKVLDGSVTATGGGGDMELNTVSLTSGVDVDITTWTVTQPAG
jgi:hypothetical protein